MQSLFLFTTPPHPCSYLPDERASLEYEVVGSLRPDEYLRRMLAGWRRFGHTLFHPVCGSCRACRPLRVRAADFRPDRSQRRCLRANATVEMRVGPPSVTREKLILYERYHAFQAEHKGWPEAGGGPEGYADSFVRQPFPVEEWCYYADGRLAGVGYVDALADPAGQGGLSLIYFFYDPDLRALGLGTFNVLTALGEARRRDLPFVYLGYFVAGCGSLEYKARFRPNEALQPDGSWAPLAP